MTMSEPLSPLSPPESPAESDPSPAQSPREQSPPASQTQFPPLGRGIPTLRTASDTGMTHSSTPLGNVNAARKPVGASNLPSSMQAKMRAFHLSRQGAPPQQSDVNAIPMSPSSPHGALTGGVPSGPVVGGMVPSPGGFRLPGSARPQPLNSSSAPVVPRMPPNGSGGLAAKRGLGAGLKLSDATSSPPSPAGGTKASAGVSKPMENAFSKYSDFIDTTTGTLRFKGKATLHGSGVEFSGGSTFSISLDEVDTLEELGKGNYGTVYQVRHARPRIRRPGMGLAGNKAPNSVAAVRTEGHGQRDDLGNVMAMKEIRLELDDAKFAAIIMELDVLHRCVSPFIIDFYGAFFQEGAVYICMEYMDGGSIDKLYADGVPEGVLRKVALSTVMGLKSLKDEHNIIHRDVKPTNILVNQRGQVKLCDFGVSGNLVASIAKTNIGCQSYMAPERISSGGIAQAGANPGGGTYSVQSDIWSLGLTLIECALGRYPYPPETYNNIFSQLSAIVDGDPPDLPREGYSDASRDFVRSCLHKKPMQRPTYAALMRHAWLAPLLQPASIAEDAEGEAEAEAEAADTSAAPSAAAQTTPAASSSASLARAVSTLLAASAQSPSSSGPDAERALAIDSSDNEIARWVTAALQQRWLGHAKSPSARPALHTVNLEEVQASPVAQGS